MERRKTRWILWGIVVGAALGIAGYSYWEATQGPPQIDVVQVLPELGNETKVQLELRRWPDAVVWVATLRDGEIVSQRRHREVGEDGGWLREIHVLLPTGQIDKTRADSFTVEQGDQFRFPEGATVMQLMRARSATGETWITLIGWGPVPGSRVEAPVGPTTPARP